MIPSIARKKTKLLRRPEGYNTGSNLPYFNQKCGEELIPFLQKLIDEPSKKISFCPAKINKKKATLYHQLNQGWMWLMEHHPEKEKWKELRERYEICRELSVIEIRRRVFGQPLANSGLVEDDHTEHDREKVLEWKRSLIEYVESEADVLPVYDLTSLRLTDRDLEWLSTWLGGLDDVVATIVITHHRVKIKKDPNLARAIKQKRGG